jgi:hypothetical protein
MQVRKKKITRFRECCTHSQPPLLSLAWGAIYAGSKHLPNVPSEADVLENGLDVASMQAIQQQKIEELTLYTIDQEKRIAAQQKRLEDLEALIGNLLKR